MNLLITGLPGVGKGTQSELIVEKFNGKIQVKNIDKGACFMLRLPLGKRDNS